MSIAARSRWQSLRKVSNNGKRTRRRLKIEPLEPRLPLAGGPPAVDTGSLGTLAVERMVDFETLGANLAAEAAWNGPAVNGEQRTGIDGDTVTVGSFVEAGVSFTNIFSQDFESWNGWAYSNKTDSSTPGFGNQLSAFTGIGADDSATYAVAFRDTRDGVAWEDAYPLPEIALTAGNENLTFESVMITNTTYAALAMRDGDAFTEKFGGPTGNDPDWFLLTISGTDGTGESVGAVELYLADYRFADNSQDYILDEWTSVDLTALENATHLSFQITSSDVGLFGLNTPAYFALDNLRLEEAADGLFGVASLESTASGFVAQFNQPIDATTVSLYDSPDGPDVTLVGVTQGNIAGSLVIEPADNSITFVSSRGPIAPDNYTVTIRGGENGLKSLLGGSLDGNGDGEAGDDFVGSMTVAPPAANAVTVGIPDFVRGPGQTVNLPADSSTGIPLAISDGTGVRSVVLQIRYDPALLTLTGARIDPALPAGATAELSHTAAGEAVIRFANSADLPAGPQSIVHLEASVPSDDASLIYRSVGLIDLHSASIRDAADTQLPAIEDDAIHLASYFGDPSGNGQINASDASLVARFAASIDRGFLSAGTVDPAVVADISGNGRVNAVDASRIARFAAQIPVSEIPPIPSEVVIRPALARVRDALSPPASPQLQRAEFIPVGRPAGEGHGPAAGTQLAEPSREMRRKVSQVVQAVDAVLSIPGSISDNTEDSSFNFDSSMLWETTR